MMKHTYFYLIITVLLTFIWSCKPTMEGNVKTGNDEPVYIYTFEDKPSIEISESKKQIQKYLNLKTVPEPYFSKEENRVYYYDDIDPNISFEQNMKTGDFSFSLVTSEYIGKAVPELPSSKEAQIIAMNYLRKEGLSPKNEKELQLAHSGGLRSQDVVAGNKPGPVIDKLLTLTYVRKIDQIPVIGPGSKIIINIGDKGEVLGVTRNWRELNLSSRKVVEATELVPLKEAEKKLKEKIESEFGKEVNYKVISHQKSYFDNGESYLQPVWAFETEIRINDQKISPFKYLAVIEMMKKSPEPLNLNQIDPRSARNIKNADPKSNEQQGGNQESD